MPTSKLEEQPTSYQQQDSFDTIAQDSFVTTAQCSPVANGKPSCETKSGCHSSYKTMSFIIPCVAVAMMYSCEKDCGVTAIVSSLLAGCSGRLLYSLMKRIKHRNDV